MLEGLDQVQLIEKSKSSYPVPRSTDDFESPVLSRRQSQQNKRRQQPSQGSQEKESSTLEHTPEPELKSQQSHVSSIILQKPSMTEAELDQKLKDFAGAKQEIDEKTNALIGKLLVDEADENVNPDSETYSKLWALLGGPIPIVCFVAYAQFQKFWDNYVERINAEFSVVDPEKQQDLFSTFMTYLAWCTLLQVLMRQLRGWGERRTQRHMGSEIVKTTLEKVLLAPVNLFFDITPVGKILKIFQDDIHIFRNHLFDPLKHIIGMLSHVVVVATLMLRLGFWESIIGFTFIGTIFYQIIPYFMVADNHLHKVGGSLWHPIHSYFYECMRGTPVIRAFGQEKSIMAK